MKREYNNTIYDCSEEFSHRVFKIPQVEIPNDTVVYASSFYQEGFLDAQVFPKDMKGVTFINCNLDNCFIPEGNIVIGGTQKRIMVQNDLNDWILDEDNNPVKPVDHQYFEKFGLEVPKPEDIPETKCESCIDLRKVAEELKAEEVKPK